MGGNVVGGYSAEGKGFGTKVRKPRQKGATPGLDRLAAMQPGAKAPSPAPATPSAASPAPKAATGLPAAPKPSVGAVGPSGPAQTRGPKEAFAAKLDAARTSGKFDGAKLRQEATDLGISHKDASNYWNRNNAKGKIAATKAWQKKQAAKKKADRTIAGTGDNGTVTQKDYNAFAAKHGDGAALAQMQKRSDGNAADRSNQLVNESMRRVTSKPGGVKLSGDRRQVGSSKATPAAPAAPSINRPSAGPSTAQAPKGGATVPGRAVSSGEDFGEGFSKADAQDADAMVRADRNIRELKAQAASKVVGAASQVVDLANKTAQVPAKAIDAVGQGVGQVKKAGARVASHPAVSRPARKAWDTVKLPLDAAKKTGQAVKKAKDKVKRNPYFRLATGTS